MCGICGFTNRGGSPSALLSEMLAQAEHRGPDGEGRFSDERVSFGHRRTAGTVPQPFAFGQNGRYTLVFDGRIYNCAELRESLPDFRNLQSKTDIEVFAAAYARWGKDFLPRLSGMWAFAVYDRELKKIFSARDRFGIKPFYYLQKADGFFAFSSEIKQLLALPDVPRKANRARLAAFLALGELDSGDETLFEGIFQLPPGHFLEYDIASGKRSVCRWNIPDETSAAPESYNDSAIALKTLFTDAVRRCEQGGAPVGYCLSGGIDSSAILAVSSQQNPEISRQCVHSSSAFPQFDESRFASLAADAAGAKLHIIRPDFSALFGTLDQIIWHMDEPFGSTSVYAQWCVCQKSRALGFSVMLDGQGADEQLAGYTPFLPVWLAGFRKRRDKKGYKNAVRRWKQGQQPSLSRRLAIRTLAAAYCVLPEKTASSLLARVSLRHKPFSKTLQKLALHTVRFHPVTDEREYIKSYIEHGLPPLLHYGDRNSAAFSVESRLPFLDTAFSAALSRIPMDYKRRGGESKAVFREAMKGILPEDIRVRKDKMGFSTPESEWIKQNPELFRAELKKSCGALGSLLDKTRVLRWFDKGHGQSAGDFTVWRIIAAGRWAELFKVAVD